MAQSSSIKHKGWKWSTADASNPTLVMVLDNTSKAVHITDAADASTDWAVDAASHATVYIHSATTPATNFIKMWHDGTNAHFMTDGAAAMLFGDGTEDVDVKVFLGSTNAYALFDVGNARFSLVGVDMATDTAVVITNATATSTTTTGALIVTGGIATAADITCGDDLFMASGGVINWDNGNATITHSATVLEFGVTWLRMAGSNRLCFRDTAVNMQSPNDGKLVITVDGAQNTALSLVASDASGGICLQAASIFFNVATYLDFTNCTTGSFGIKLLDGQSDAFSIYHASADMMVFDTTSDIVSFACDVRIDSGNQLFFRNGNSYIESPSGSKLHLYSAGTGEDAISVETAAGGSFKFNTWLNLLKTTDVSTREGDVWYDGTTNKIHFRDDTQEREVTSG